MIAEIERVVGALNRADVRYLVVGGVAVVLHGYLRTTVDLDLVVGLDQENLGRALEELSRLGYHPRAPVRISDFGDPKTRRRWIREKGLEVFSLWNDAGMLELDLFAEEPFDFDEVYARAPEVRLETVSVKVISIEDLIALKAKADRPRDREDIKALRALSEEEGPSE